MATTVTYGEEVKGWTSFHSYEPEWMSNLGSEFFSFKNGNLYKHDTNDTRTEFYGSTHGCSVTFVSNKAPSDVKVFKNIKLETNHGDWYATLSSEQEQGEIGSQSNLKFVDKEHMRYGYIRRLSTDKLNFNELSILGIGDLESLTGNDYTFTSTIVNQVSANNADGIGGDELYFNDGTNKLIGVIDSYTGQTISTASSANTPAVGDFCFVVKNPQSESYGLRGYYAEITLKNDSTSFVELFASNSEVFKSYM